jgi:hypothetical protein
MTPSGLRDQSLAKGTYSILVRATANGRFAGYAFATRWDYDGRQICWVTELCVDPDFRGTKLATKVKKKKE